MPGLAAVAQLTWLSWPRVLVTTACRPVALMALRLAVSWRAALWMAVVLKARLRVRPKWTVVRLMLMIARRCRLAMLPCLLMAPETGPSALCLLLALAPALLRVRRLLLPAMTLPPMALAAMTPLHCVLTPTARRRRSARVRRARPAPTR